MTTQKLPQQLPQQISATIHQDAITRVSTFFNATLTDILGELLQNARRSAATKVDITIDDDLITVTDDGLGIEDPAAILAFGQTAWENDTARNEHPAGMGLYALARCQDVTIRSSRNGGPAWQVNLTPDHFVGKLPAPIETLTNPEPHGTSVTFTTPDSINTMPDWSVNTAAKHYPLPVSLNQAQVDQQDFLRQAIHIEEWQGVRIGVYCGAAGSMRFHPTADSMNFHGIQIRSPGLPEITSLSNKWNIKVDVVDCPQLELTLPARKEVVETPFMNDLRTACRRAIYHAISLQPEPVDVPKEVQDDARDLGIDLPDARPILRRWSPGISHTIASSYESKYTLPVNDDTIVANLADLPCPDQQSFARAAAANRMLDRLMEPNRHLQGYDWYDQLPRAENVHITITTAGADQDLHTIRETGVSLADPRPDRILFTLETADSAGNKADLLLPSDVAFENDEEEYSDDNKPVITKDSTVTADDLADLMIDSFFYPDDDYRIADSYETQRDNRKADYLSTAVTILSSKEDALRDNLILLADQHLSYRLPPGTTAVIRLPHRGTTVVTLEYDEP